MQIKQTNQNALKYEYDVTMTADEISSKIDIKLQEIGKTVKLPGFRPGKVPLKVLKSKYGQAVMGEVLDAAVNEAVRQAINENELRPAMQPKVEVKKFEESEGLECSVEIEVLPEFDVKPFDNISLEKLVAKAQDKDLETTMKRLASNSKDSKPIEGNRKSKKGDIAVIDFDGTVNGESRPGMKGNAFQLELGSGSFVDNFEDQIIGHKAGDHVTVTVTFPENYGAKELQGVEAKFEVDIKELREKVEAEINDDFAKKFGFDSLDKLKDAIKEQMNGEYSNLSRMDIKKKLLDIIDKEYNFDIPQGMVDAEFFAIWQQLKGSLHPEDPNNRAKDKTPAADKKEEKEYKEIANRRVKLGLVLAEAGRVNKVEITKQEIQQAVVAEARKYPGQEAKVFEFYQKNPQAVESIKAPIYEEKVVDFILSQAKVTEKEVTAEELTKIVEEAEF